MRVWMVFLVLLLPTMVFCHSDTGVEARVRDIAISCQVDRKTSRVEVTLANRSRKRVVIQYVNNEDARGNYTVFVTDRNGEPLLKAPPAPSGPGIRFVYESSSAPIFLGPQERKSETFSLSAFAQLPDKGKFRIRVGRGLFTEMGSPFRLDASRMIWCKPIYLVLGDAL